MTRDDFWNSPGVELDALLHRLKEVRKDARALSSRLYLTIDEEFVRSHSTNELKRVFELLTEVAAELQDVGENGATDYMAIAGQLDSLWQADAGELAG